MSDITRRTTLRRAAMIALIWAVGTPPAIANPNYDLGPPVGTKLAGFGTPSDQNGTPRSLGSLMGKNGLMLFFFRSADWCPFCQAQLLEIN